MIEPVARLSLLERKASHRDQAEPDGKASDSRPLMTGQALLETVGFEHVSRFCISYLFQ